jgi:hypothetical protein
MREAYFRANPESEESMSPLETTRPGAAATEPQPEAVRRFLELSAAYLFSSRYRASLRAAFARKKVLVAAPSCHESVTGAA